MAGQALVERRLGGSDVEVAQLHLRLRPGKRRRPFEGVGVLMLVDGIEQRLARGGHHRPEGDPRRAAGLDAQRAGASANIGSSTVPTVFDRRRPSIAAIGVADVVAAAQEAGAVGLDLDLADRLAFDDRQMGGP